MNRYKIAMATLMLAGLTSMSVWASAWAKNTEGWWYNNGDGTWPANCWQWIDGNYDGIAECYYFNPSGYCLQNTTTPDGYSVNTDGAWTVNGVVQTQAVVSLKDNSSNAQTTVSIEDVEKAYRAYMLPQNTDYYNPIRYELVYLDGDTIPELIYASSNMHAAGVSLCTYQNGQVCPITNQGFDGFGASGMIEYYPGTGLFEMEDGHMGEAVDKIYLQQGSQALEVYYADYNVDGYHTEYDEFRIFGVNTTRTDAEKYKNQLVGSLTSAYFEYDQATKL